jgi:5-oxoprolinase (ATP-hydrolysing) subunit A
LTNVPAELRTIDLNADVGEADDVTGKEVERALLGLVTSAHVACGGHAGTEQSMRHTVQAALAVGVHVGAHPSYPDRDGFGRRPMEMAAGDLRASLAEQIGALVAVTTSLGTRVHSVKPHGALYGEVGRGGSSCDALVAAVHEHCDADTALILPAGSPAVAVLRAAGVPVLQEGFSDRAYAPDGGLVARSAAGSVYDEPEVAASQALELALRGSVVAYDGSVIRLAIDTLCVHGDSPNAVAMAGAVRRTLADAGIAVRAPVTHDA